MGTDDGRKRPRSRSSDNRNPRTKIDVEASTKTKIFEVAQKNFAHVNRFVKTRALKEVRRTIAAKKKLPEVDDEILSVIEQARPNALVYTVPIVGAKIVASPNDDGWKGVVFHPEKPGSMFAWTNEDLNLPPWARAKRTVKAMLFVASRIDDDGLAHFRVPGSKLLVSAKWEKDRWQSGFVVDTKDGRRQEWAKGGWFATMNPGPFNYLAYLRWLMNMLTGTLTVKDGGISHT